MGTEVSLQSSDGGDHGRRKNDCKIAPSRLLVVIGSLIFGTFTLYEGMPSVQQNVEMHIRGQNGPKRPTYQQYARRLEAKDWNFDAEDTKWMQQHYRPYTAKKLFVGSAVNDPQFHFKSQLHNFGDHGLNMQLFGWSSEGTGSSFATDKLNGVRKLLDTLAEDTLVLLVDIGDVLTVANEEAIVRRFVQMKDCDLITGAEPSCDGFHNCVEWMAPYVPADGDSVDRYPTAGTILGYASALKQFLFPEDLKSVLASVGHDYGTAPSDQYHLTAAFAANAIKRNNNPSSAPRACRDTHHLIFATLDGDDSLVDVETAVDVDGKERKRFVHTRTHGHPLIVHANGPKQSLDRIRHVLGYYEPMCDQSCYDNFRVHPLPVEQF